MSVIEFKTRKKVDACVRSAMASLEQEDVAAADTPNSRFQRLLQIFRTLRPLFTFLLGFPFIPQLWRSGLGVVVQLLESLAKDGTNVTVQFKAGKDLEPAA
jgi:hypothetical protein